MSFQAQTATNFADLVQRIVTFLTATGHAFGKALTGTGNGDLINYNGTATSVAETWTLTATSATTFTVVGSVSGAQANATVGTPYTTARIAFTITAGGTPYVAGDQWKISTSPKWTLTRDITGMWSTGGTFTGAWTNGANLWDKNGATSATIPNASLPGTAVAQLIKAADILEVSITPENTGNAPSAFTVDWSDNGTTWTTAATFSGLTSGWTYRQPRRFSFASAGSHLYWRINITAGNTTPVTVNSIDFYTTIGSAQTLTQDWPFFVVKPPGNDGLLANTSLHCLAVDQTSIDNYSFYMVATNSYDTGLLWNGQPGYSGYGVVPAGNFSMKYWLTVNGCRLALGLQVSTTYHAGYYGLMLPYARPSVYALPLFLGGSSNGSRWSDVSNNTHCYPRANQGVAGHALVRDITGIWRQVAAHQDGNSPSATARLAPNAMSSGGLNSCIRENFDGSYPLLPFVPVVTGVGPMGELDGVFWTSGFGQAAEATIVQNKFTHIVLQNAFRTTQGDYFAQRLD
jgi:hypothetical protein